MANLWDTLDEDQRTQIMRAYINEQGGNRNGENSSRAKEQLVNNPNLVQRIAKENGIISESEDVMQEGEEDEDGADMIEKNVMAGMEETVEDNQATGGLSKSAIPPAKPGESMEDYMKRLQMFQKGMLTVDDDDME